MTSRQCLFHQVTGCSKSKIDDYCIGQCENSASITNMKEDSVLIKKSKGNYHTVYNGINFLNTEIATNPSGLFDGFCIDLRAIATTTQISADKKEVVTRFLGLLNGDPVSADELRAIISPTTNDQYHRGI